MQHRLFLRRSARQSNSSRKSYRGRLKLSSFVVWASYSTQKRPGRPPGHIQALGPPEKQKNFWDVLGKDLGVSSLENWYQISSAKLPLTARSLIRVHHGGSFSAALKTAYPDHDWDLFRFLEVPSGYWQLKENRKAYLDKLGPTLGVTKLEDWYSVTRTQYFAHGNRKFNRYYRALPAALMDVYPEHRWLPWKFESWVVPRNYWATKENRMNALHWLKSIMNPDGSAPLSVWYHLSTKDIRKHGLYSLLTQHYKSSFPTMLKELYPHHEWLEWHFSSCPRAFWNGTSRTFESRLCRTSFLFSVFQTMAERLMLACASVTEKSNRKKYLEWAGEQLGVKRPEDWYQIRALQVRQLGAGMLSHYRNSLVSALVDLYPEHQWDLKQFYKATEGTMSDSKDSGLG